MRRLHDEYRYTTVYVTHDQSEAMTTADLIAVMNAGRIEQAGTPEEIYNRPRSEFVARFIGVEQCGEGQGASTPPTSTVAGATLRCTGEPMTAGKDAAISIRQHEIRLWRANPRRRGRTWCRQRSSATSSSATAATIWSSLPTARSCAW